MAARRSYSDAQKKRIVEKYKKLKTEYPNQVAAKKAGTAYTTLQKWLRPKKKKSKDGRRSPKVVHQTIAVPEHSLSTPGELHLQGSGRELANFISQMAKNFQS